MYEIIKASQLFEQFINLDSICKTGFMSNELAKNCAKISAKNEFFQQRELLINLKSCRLIENEKVYLIMLQDLIDKEQRVLNEIDKL
jgi:hypothetical protein